MPNNTTLLSRQIVLRALGDPQFFQAVPEFASLQPKLKTMGVDMSQRRGCKGCKQRRVEQNVFRDFLHIVQTLPPASVVQLKQYLGVDTLLVTIRNSTTGGFEPRRL